jgi:hypothetical protein
MLIITVFFLFYLCGRLSGMRDGLDLNYISPTLTKAEKIVSIEVTCKSNIY